MIVFGAKKLIWLFLVLLNFNSFSTCLQKQRTIRNQNRLINLINYELDRIEKQYQSEFANLNDLNVNKQNLNRIILVNANKTYWFFALNRYRKQVLSDLRSLKILKKKSVRLALDSENNSQCNQVLIKVDQVKVLLTKINEYAVSLIQEKEYFSITDIDISKILSGLVWYAALVYSAFIGLCMAVLSTDSGTYSIATPVFVGLASFAIMQAMCWFVINGASIDW